MKQMHKRSCTKSAVAPNREIPATITARVILGVFGSYLVAYLSTVAMARFFKDGTMVGPMIGLLIYSIVATWVFAVRRLRIATGGIVGLGLALAAILWLVAEKQA